MGEIRRGMPAQLGVAAERGTAEEVLPQRCHLGGAGEVWGRWRGDAGEMEGRRRGDGGEMEGRWRGDGGETEGRWRGDGGEM